MGRFKTISIKRKNKFKIIFLILSIVLISIFASRVSIKQKYVKYITSLYLGVSFNNEKKEVPVIKEEMPIEVYIYNSHQYEKYADTLNNPYNINYDVLFASYILQEYLENYNVSSIVENNKLSSYVDSKKHLYEKIENYKDLKLFIDLHRDAGTHDLTTHYYDNKNYAKTLFVVGFNHDNYERNKNNMKIINEYMEQEVPGISRGILEKSSFNANGIYNQDVNEYVLLIEVGGENNYIEEVNNTLKVLAKCIYKFLRESV